MLGYGLGVIEQLGAGEAEVLVVVHLPATTATATMARAPRTSCVLSRGVIGGADVPAPKKVVSSVVGAPA